MSRRLALAPLPAQDAHCPNKELLVQFSLQVVQLVTYSIVGLPVHTPGLFAFIIQHGFQLSFLAP